MKKIFFFAALAFVSAALFTACSSEDDNYLDKGIVPLNVTPSNAGENTDGGQGSSAAADSTQTDSIPAVVDPLYNIWSAAVTEKGTDITMEITQDPYFDFVNYINTGSKGSANDPSTVGHTALNIKYYYTKTTIVDPNKVPGAIIVVGAVPTITVEQGYITTTGNQIWFWVQKQYKSTDGHSYTAVAAADIKHAVDIYKYQVFENVLYLFDLAGGITTYTSPVPTVPAN